MTIIEWTPCKTEAFLSVPIQFDCVIFQIFFLVAKIVYNKFRICPSSLDRKIIFLEAVDSSPHDLTRLWDAQLHGDLLLPHRPHISVSVNRQLGPVLAIGHKISKRVISWNTHT